MVLVHTSGSLSKRSRFSGRLRHGWVGSSGFYSVFKCERETTLTVSKLSRVAEFSQGFSFFRDPASETGQYHSAEQPLVPKVLTLTSAFIPHVLAYAESRTAKGLCRQGHQAF